MTIGIKRFFSTIIFAALLISLLPLAYADEAEVPEIPYFDLPCTVTAIKVGLYSGSESLYFASLRNDGGDGYELGYYDFSRQFRKIATVGSSDISIAKDTKWHILYDESYDSFASAASAAASLGACPAYIDGTFKVVYGDFDTEGEARAALKSGATVLSGGISVTDTEGENAIFLFKSDRIHFAAMPISDTGAAQAELNGYIYRGGFELLPNDRDRLTVINYVGIEDYVKGVLPYEVGGNWPSASLMAQAVCARTYAINNINTYIEDGFDVRSDTYSQVYYGVSGTTENTNVAADQTAGKFVRYDGAICRVYYMSSSGGATESGANVFGERREYLSGVTDPYEGTEDFYNKTWSETKSEAALLSRLSRYGYELSDIADIKASYSETGNVIALEFISANGTSVTVRLTECYMVPGLNSIRYTVSVSEDDEDQFVFSGNGWGHNCGMSQWGAYSLAKNYDFSCDEIIDFYFSGAYIG